MERSGLPVGATADPDVGGHRDKGNPQPGRDEEEIGLNKIGLLGENIRISSYSSLCLEPSLSFASSRASGGT